MVQSCVKYTALLRCKNHRITFPKNIEDAEGDISQSRVSDVQNWGYEDYLSAWGSFVKVRRTSDKLGSFEIESVSP